MRPQTLYKNKTALGSEIEEHTAGLVLTRELVRNISVLDLNLACAKWRFFFKKKQKRSVGVRNGCAKKKKVKALLTKAQMASVAAKAKLFGTKAAVRSVLASGHRLSVTNQTNASLNPN
ncbi:MAG: hypothetical protein P3M74_00495 [Candidatus Hodgkinia cicadicola]|nr:MAG: hypothetical protein P3M74_00495 [Candidatus Hodgkinia cicadicola]